MNIRADENFCAKKALKQNIVCTKLDKNGQNHTYTMQKRILCTVTITLYVECSCMVIGRNAGTKVENSDSINGSIPVSKMNCKV